MTRCPCYQIISTTTVWFPGWCPQRQGRMPRAAFIIPITGHVLNTTSWGPYASSCSKETWDQAQAELLWKFRRVHQSATLGLCGTSQSNTGEFWICHSPAPAPTGRDSGLCCWGGWRGNPAEAMESHREDGTAQAMCCKDKARASSGCLSITHKPMPWLPRNGSDPSLSACPLQQVWAHSINIAKCEVTVPDHAFVLFYRQNMSKFCPNPNKQAHQTLGLDTSIWHLQVDVQENSQSCLSCL